MCCLAVGSISLFVVESCPHSCPGSMSAYHAWRVYVDVARQEKYNVGRPQYQPLPVGWKKWWSREHQRHFYACKTSGISKWDQPTEADLTFSLTDEQRELGKVVMNMMRADRRKGRLGGKEWVPLEYVMRRNRCKGIDRTDLVSVICWDTHKGHSRFDVAWALNLDEEDGYTYWIKVNEPLIFNRYGQ